MQGYWDESKHESQHDKKGLVSLNQTETFKTIVLGSQLSAAAFIWSIVYAVLFADGVMNPLKWCLSLALNLTDDTMQPILYRECIFFLGNTFTSKDESSPQYHPIPDIVFLI